MIEECGYKDKIRIEVDGGVNPSVMGPLAAAGASMYVSGSALMKPPRTVEGYASTIKEMRREMEEAEAAAAAAAGA